METTLAAPQRDDRLKDGVISHLGLFGGVAPQLLATFARRCWVLPARRGEVIARLGARLPGVFALAYGSVKLALRDGGARQRLLRLVPPGQTFGEADALLGRASRYDALALAECKLVVMPVEGLLELAERDSRLGRNLIMTLAQRSLDLLADYEAATTRRGAQRLAAYLESLAGSNGDGSVVELPVSKTLVAAQLGVKKETLSRLLSELAARRLIAVSRRRISILDREGLASTAGR